MGGNEQLTITLPKEWSTVNNLKKGDYVTISIANEPAIEILEEIKKNKRFVRLHKKNKEIIEGRVKCFYMDGVLLDSGIWVKFADIIKINRRVKKIEKGDEIVKWK